MMQASSEEAHLPMVEQVRGRSPPSTACANMTAKRTFCLATVSGQGSVLLGNGQHPWVEAGGEPCSLINSEAPRELMLFRTSSVNKGLTKAIQFQHGDRGLC